MESKTKEQLEQESMIGQKIPQDKNSALVESTLSYGQKFLKELREMPYDNSKVGQVSVTIIHRISSKAKVAQEKPDGL